MVNTDSPRSESMTTAAATAGGGAGGDVVGASTSLRSLPWSQVVRGAGEQDSSSSSPSPSLPSAVSSVAGGAPVVSLPVSPPPPIASSSAPAPAITLTVVPEQGSGLGSVSDSSGANAQEESSVDSNVAAPTRRPAWNRPVNGGVVEPVTVMGGDTGYWPPLSVSMSVSIRPGSRSTQDSIRPISNGSSTAPQAPVINQPTQRQVSANANVNANAHPNVNAHGNANPTSNANHAPGRHRSVRHRGGGGNNNNNNHNHNGGGSAHGGFNRPPPPPPPPLPPPFPVVEIPYGNMLPPPPPGVMDTSVVGPPRPMGGMRPQSHGPNDHSSQRNTSRRGNFGPRPRGDGSYHNNHGGRRDQDRRDGGHMQQFVHPAPAFIPPPPPGTPPYGPPLPMRPFPGPMGFDMASPVIYVPTFPPESFRGVPGVPIIAQAPPPPMFYPVVEPPPLNVLIVNQIDYYFSDENLVKDDYLRSNMDDEGWVPIALIAKFPRVAHLTSNTEYILECLKGGSKAVDVQGDKVRRRDDWRRWIHTPARHNGESTGEAIDNAVVNSVQNLSLGDDASSSRNNSSDATGEFTGRSEMANGDGTAEAAKSSSQTKNLVA